MQIRRVGVAAALVLAAVTLLACEAAGDGGGAAAADTGAGGGGGADVAVAGGDGGGGGGDARDAAPQRVDPQRIGVAEARAWMLSDAHDTLLVCSYAEPSLCAGKMLEGAITLTDLEAQEAAGELALDREIVFYCS